MSEAYHKNTKEAYEAIGRFVEAFERLVGEVRETSIELVARDKKHGRLVEIAFHHGAMTAKPLFEVMQAIIAERLAASVKAQADPSDTLEALRFLNVKGEPVQFSEADQAAILGALAFASGRYNALVNKRNNLLHATWFIGYSSVDDPDSKEFYVRKFTTSGEGLRQIELPTKATELMDLLDVCQDLLNWIGCISSCLAGVQTADATFQRDKDKVWWLVSLSGSRSTLPKI